MLLRLIEARAGTEKLASTDTLIDQKQAVAKEKTQTCLYLCASQARSLVSSDVTSKCGLMFAPADPQSGVGGNLHM